MILISLVVSIVLIFVSVLLTFVSFFAFQVISVSSKKLSHCESVLKKSPGHFQNRKFRNRWRNLFFGSRYLLATKKYFSPKWVSEGHRQIVKKVKSVDSNQENLLHWTAFKVFPFEKFHWRLIWFSANLWNKTVAFLCATFCEMTV